MNTFVPVAECRRRQVSRIAGLLASGEAALTLAIRTRRDRHRYLVDARGHHRIGRAAFAQWAKAEVTRG